MINIELRNISNIKVNKDCYKVLKKLSIDKEVSLQEVVAEILERSTSKKQGQQEVIQV